MTNAISLKHLLIGGLMLLFCIWLGWYTFQYLKIERGEVRRVASVELRCPADQIKIGPSYQLNDGPGEFPVEGCGRSSRILCDDNGYRYGMIKQYFVVDLTCRAQESR